MQTSEFLNKQNEIVGLLTTLTDSIDNDNYGSLFHMILKQTLGCISPKIDIVDLATQLGVGLETVVEWKNGKDYPNTEVRNIVYYRLIKILNKYQAEL
jgi:hypothetical protein